MKLTAAKPDFGSDTSGAGPVSYADLVCPPTADQPGVIFSALHTVIFCGKDFGIVNKHMSAEFLDCLVRPSSVNMVYLLINLQFPG
jgi:hypothetical protein